MSGRFPPQLCLLCCRLHILLSHFTFWLILHPAVEPVMRECFQKLQHDFRFKLRLFFFHIHNPKTVLMRKLIRLKSGLLLLRVDGVIKRQSLKSSCTWILGTQMFYVASHHRRAECTSLIFILMNDHNLWNNC